MMNDGKNHELSKEKYVELRISEEFLDIQNKIEGLYKQN